MTQNPALPATDSLLSRAVLAAVCLVALVASPAAAAPLGTGFTYQGVLKDMGTPQDGFFDFTFELYDNEFGGSQVGATLSMPDALNVLGSGIVSGSGRSDRRRRSLSDHPKPNRPHRRSARTRPRISDLPR